jgi:hypothetical protein
LITFLIFDLTKSRKAILFDLIVILVIQFGALAYGIYTTYAQRPVAIVMIDDFVVPATMEHYGGKLESADELLKYSDERPPIIYSKLPLNKEALAEINRKKLDEKVLEHAQTEYYQSPEGMVTFLEEHQPRMQEALEHYKAGPAYETWLKANGKTADDVYIVRFSGRYGSAWLVFDRDGKYLSYFEV